MCKCWVGKVAVGHTPLLMLSKEAMEDAHNDLDDRLQYKMLNQCTNKIHYLSELNGTKGQLSCSRPGIAKHLRGRVLERRPDCLDHQPTPCWLVLEVRQQPHPKHPNLIWKHAVYRIF